MASVQGTITGTHPLGEPLIQAILDYKYGRAENEPVLQEFDKELRDLIALQHDLQFPLISTGNLGIEDMIRPFTRTLSALHSYEKIGDLPINRYHYTNTFYRQPTVVESLPEKSNVISTDINPITKKNSYSLDVINDIPSKFIIVGPYSFANLVNIDNNSPYKEIDTLIFDAAKLIASEIQQLDDNIKQVQLDDPHLVWDRVPRKLRPTLIEAYELISQKVSSEVIVHTYFDTAHNIISLLQELEIDGFGIDFHHTNPLELKDYDFGGKIIQAGLIDSQNFVPKQNGEIDTSDTRYIAQLGRSLLELDPKRLQIGTTTGLEYLPRDIADQKLQQVHDVVKLIKED